MKLLEANKKLVSLVQIEKKCQEVEDLVEKCNYKTCIGSTQNYLFTQPLISAYQPPIFSTPPTVQTRGANY